MPRWLCKCPLTMAFLTCDLAWTVYAERERADVAHCNKYGMESCWSKVVVKAAGTR